MPRERVPALAYRVPVIHGVGDDELAPASFAAFTEGEAR
jgi:hypothetical protein